MHDLRARLLYAAARQHAVGLSRGWIGRVLVRVRKLVAGKIMPFERGREAAGHRELRVDEDAARAGDMRDQPVEDDSFSLVEIESLINEVFQKTSRLRRAETDRPARLGRPGHRRKTMDSRRKSRV